MIGSLPLEGQFRRATEALRRSDFATAATVTYEIMAAPPADVPRLAQLAHLLFAQDKYADSAKIYRRAIALRPDEPQLLYNLAAVLRLLGDFEEAESLCDRAISLGSLDPQAQWLRSSLRRQTASKNHIEELSAVLRTTRDPLARSWIGYALAKELEDVEDYDSAFAAMADAGEIRRSTLQYDVRQDEDILSAISETFDEGCFGETSTAAPGGGPTFVIGLPRTGTTVVERILSYDGRLIPAGELPDFAHQLVRLARESGKPVASPRDLVKSSRDLNLAEVGRRYQRGVRARLGEDVRFIDKLPINFLYAGLIHLAMPDARIIHLVRNPVDTCLAIYKQSFDALYPFSYNIEELVRYHGAYRRLMDHWRNILVPRGAMMDVLYEDLVQQPEPIARQLRTFCGLPWNAACLDLPSHIRPASSASAVQVRQPINAASVGKADKYGSHLNKLRKLLGEQQNSMGT
jgi:tetratricopeptide (TPR) repeat protein